MKLRLVFPVFLLLTISASTQPPADSPVGRWVAEHPSMGGIGSWWDFRADGTFTTHLGAMVTSPVKRSGDTLVMPPDTTNGAPVRVKFRIEGDRLYLKPLASPEQGFTREGPAPAPADPLLGKWRPDPPADPDSKPETAAIRKAMANGLYVFAADGTQSVRIPFTTREGTWDAAAHTFHFRNEAHAYSFRHDGAKLRLGQPPDNKKSDTYLPDPIL